MTTSSQRVTELFSFQPYASSSTLHACRRLLSAVAGVCSLWLLGAIAITAHAQNVTFAGVQATLPANGPVNPSGVAVDAAGDVFIADSGNNRVVEIPAGCTSGSCQTTVGFNLSNPEGVAVDGAGDVFIADTNNNQVVEVPAGCTTATCQTTVASGLSLPAGVAVFVDGEFVYIANTGANEVVMVYGGQEYTVGSGLMSPSGVAGSNDGILIADTGNNRVVQVVAKVGGYTQTNVGSGFSSPTGVAADALGNVFVGDSGNNRAVEVPAGCTSAACQVTLGNGLKNPEGVAVNGAGDLFIADEGNKRAVEVQPFAINFGGALVGSNDPLQFLYNVTSTTTFGTPKVVTQGTANLDFTLNPGGTCTGTVTAGNSCSLTITLAPLAPGLREGAVQLFDNSGNQLTSTLVYGIGQAPAVAFGPATQTAVVTGLTSPLDVKVDAAGDVFIANGAADQVVEVPVGCTSGACQITLGSELDNATGVAVDGAGDVFISDYGNIRVIEVPASCVPTNSCQNTVVSEGLNAPGPLVVDGAGDLFIADIEGNQVVEVPAGCTSFSCQIFMSIAPSSPEGLAIDSAGDLFVGEGDPNQVVEWPRTPTGYGTPITVFTGPIGSGVAVDAAGDVFISDQSNVVEVPAGCTSATCQTILGSGLSDPFGVGVDAAGDVFIADRGKEAVYEVNRSQPPSLTFASTVIGQTSSDSPQSVTLQNIGNQPLNAVAPALVVSGPNFVQVAGSGTPPDCGVDFSAAPLAPGFICDLSVSFTPQVPGNPLSSTAVFTDNALNAPARQIISLQGVGLPNTVMVTIGASPAGLQFSVDGVNHSSGQSFTWTIGSGHTLATTTPQYPSAGVQETFANWSDGGGLSHAVTASASITSYTASFNTGYQLTTTANPPSAGTVTPVSGDYYAPNTVVNVTATPNVNYAFYNWNGDVANPSRMSTTVTMSGPQSLTANFVAAQVTVSPTSVNFGDVIVGRAGKKTVTLQNNTGKPVLIGPISLSVTLGDSSQFRFDHVCPAKLLAGKSCLIGVLFTPDAVGLSTGTLNIVTSAPGSPMEVPITAAGIARGK